MTTQPPEQPPIHPTAQPSRTGRESAPMDDAALRRDANREADRLAAAILPLPLAACGQNHGAGPPLFTDYMAHELASSHHVLMRFAGAAIGFIGRAAPAAAPNDKAAMARDLAGARCAAGAGRVLDYVRLGLLAWARRRPFNADEIAWVGVLGSDNLTDEDYERCLNEAMAAEKRKNPPPARIPRPRSANPPGNCWQRPAPRPRRSRRRPAPACLPPASPPPRAIVSCAASSPMS